MAEMGAMVGLTMNRTVPTMVAGDLATRWRHFAAVTIIVRQVEAAATNLRLLIDPRLLPARCRLYRRMAVAVAVAVAVVVVVVVVAAVVVVVVVTGDVNRSLKNYILCVF